MDSPSCSRCKERPALPERKQCAYCTDYMRDARAKFRQKAKPAGCCNRTDCSRPAAPGFTSCEECRKRVREFESRIKPKVQQRAKELRKRLRMKAFAAYGGAFCACCGETAYEFLTMDHIDGSGAEHRRVLGTKTDIYTWLKKNNFPPGFRVLCMNCNFALGYHGYCTHRGWVQPRHNGRLGRPTKLKEAA